jgi:GT2 family glycosyltransferase
VRTIDNPRRVVSPGLNAAIRAARGAIVIRMDAHTSYAPDYCRRCVAELERTGADNVGGPARTRTQGTRARAFAAAYHSPFSTGARFHDENYEGWIDTVPYGCWRKETLERLGLFDETLVRNQDDELNLRLIRAGGKIWQSPDIVSWYSPRATLTALFLQYFQYGFWKAAVVRKHRLPGSWRHLVPVAFVLTHILLLRGVHRHGAADPDIRAGRPPVAGAGAGIRRGQCNRVRGRRPEVRLGDASLSAGGVHRVSLLLGLGFLAGFRWFLPGAAQPLANPSFFTRISR